MSMTRQRRRRELEQHDLSDGGTARVTRLGWRYSYSRTFPDDQPPEVVLNLTREEAYKLLADALRRDVLELD